MSDRSGRISSSRELIDRWYDSNKTAMANRRSRLPLREQENAFKFPAKSITFHQKEAVEALTLQFLEEGDRAPDLEKFVTAVGSRSRSKRHNTRVTDGWPRVENDSIRETPLIRERVSHDKVVIDDVPLSSSAGRLGDGLESPRRYRIAWVFIALLGMLVGVALGAALFAGVGLHPDISFTAAIGFFGLVATLYVAGSKHGLRKR